MLSLTETQEAKEGAKKTKRGGKTAQALAEEPEWSEEENETLMEMGSREPGTRRLMEFGKHLYGACSVMKRLAGCPAGIRRGGRLPGDRICRRPQNGIKPLDGEWLLRGREIEEPPEIGRLLVWQENDLGSRAAER